MIIWFLVSIKIFVFVFVFLHYMYYQLILFSLFCSLLAYIKYLCYIYFSHNNVHFPCVNVLVYTDQPLLLILHKASLILYITMSNQFYECFKMLKELLAVNRIMLIYWLPGSTLHLTDIIILSVLGTSIFITFIRIR